MSTILLGAVLYTRDYEAQMRYPFELAFSRLPLHDGDRNVRNTAWSDHSFVQFETHQHTIYDDVSARMGGGWMRLRGIANQGSSRIDSSPSLLVGNDRMLTIGCHVVPCCLVTLLWLKDTVIFINWMRF
jgi:hypothetical protein